MRQEMHNAPILNKEIDISSYDVIYVGTPVYWGYMPEELVTALKLLDFKNKIVRIFVTHEGSGLAHIKDQIESVCKNIVVKDTLVIKGSQVNFSKDEVEKWVKEV